MNSKCEICGEKKKLKEIGFKPSNCTWNYYIPVTVCEDCCEKIRKANEDPRRNEGKSMKVTYNGFTGELEKLARYKTVGYKGGCFLETCDLTLYDSEKRATISFTGIKLEDVKFLGGAVTFGG